jgi:hypothetical protein
MHAGIFDASPGYVRRVNGDASLAELFERYEALPSRDAEDAKRDLVDRILDGVAAQLAEAGEGDDRHRAVRDVAVRVRLLAPGADAFDDAVLGLIDAARAAFGDTLTDVVPARSAAERGRSEPAGEVVTEASEESFPASDPPSYVAGDGA